MEDIIMSREHNELSELFMLCNSVRKYGKQIKEYNFFQKIIFCFTIFKYNKIKKEAIEKIQDSIRNNKWTVVYLRSLESVMSVYREELKDTMKNNMIFIDNINDVSKSYFKNLYFRDTKNNDIVLEIVSDNISFTVMDSNTGHTLKILSEKETNEAQSYLVYICKEKIIDMMEEFINN